MLTWSFKKNGEITDGIYSIFLKDLAKYDAINNKLVTIKGESIPIGVSDADKLGGKTKDDYLLKEEVSINGEGVIKGDIYLDSNDYEEFVSQGLVRYIGQSSSPAINVSSENIIPNPINRGPGIEVNTLEIFKETTEMTIAVNGSRINLSRGNVKGSMSCYQNVHLVKGNLYEILINFNNDTLFTKKLTVLDMENNSIGTNINDTNSTLLKLYVKPEVTGMYKTRFILEPTSDISNIYNIDLYSWSVRVVDPNNFNYGDYLTYEEKGVKYTEIVTDIKTKDINYNPDNIYSNDAKNNLAFFSDSFDLVKYVSDTPGLSGFIKENNEDKEYFKSNNSIWVGDFKNLTVAQQNSWLTTTGSCSKTITADGILKLSRTAIDNIYPDLMVSFVQPKGVEKDNYYLISFWLEDLKGRWWFEVNTNSVSKKFMLPHTVDHGTNLHNDSHLGNTVVRRRVNLIVKSEGLDLGLSIYRENNNLRYPISLDDTISIKELSVKVLDSSVWKVITPTENNTYTEFLDWDSSDIMFIPDIPLGTILPNKPESSTDVNFLAVRNQIRTHFSILGEDSFLGSIGRKYKRNNIIKYTNRGIKLGVNNFIDYFNSPYSYVLLQTSYNKIRMHRDNLGKLQLIVSDPFAGVSYNYLQWGKQPTYFETTLAMRQRISHDLNTIPNMGIVSDINFLNYAGFYNHQVYCNINTKELDYKILSNKNTRENDISSCTINKNSEKIKQFTFNLANPNKNYKSIYKENLWLQLQNDKFATWVGRLEKAETGECTGIIKFTSETEFINVFLYRGTNTPKKIKSKSKPYFSIIQNLKEDLNISYGIIERTKGSLYFRDVNTPFKLAGNSISFNEDGINLHEYNYKNTNASINSEFNIFNGMPLSDNTVNGSNGVSEYNFYYGGFSIGCDKKSLANNTKVKRIKTGSKLKLTDMLISVKDTINSDVGIKYKLDNVTQNMLDNVTKDLLK